MSPAEPPTDVDALAREIERVGRRVGEIETTATQRVGELDNLVQGLAGDVTALLAQPEPARPQAWLQVTDPGDARAILTDLVEWLDAVYLRYPNAALPSCWAWHPTVIEELWWLRCAHADAYTGRGWAVRAGAWHDQQRPRVVERIREAIGVCDLDQHKPGGQKARMPLAAPLAGHIDAVAEAWTTTGLPPQPTSEQLSHAQAYDDEQLRTSSS